MTDLTITEINARLSALVVEMLAKGLYQPKASLWIEADEGFTVHLSSGRGYGSPDYYSQFPGDQDPVAALNKAFAMIAALPDPEVAKLQNHMRRVADCIDKGREDGIDDAYIAPLVVVKEAMTENLLTAQVLA